MTIFCLEQFLNRFFPFYIFSLGTFKLNDGGPKKKNLPKIKNGNEKKRNRGKQEIERRWV